MNCLVVKERRRSVSSGWRSVGRPRARGDVAASRRAVAATCGWGWGRGRRGARKSVSGTVGDATWGR